MPSHSRQRHTDAQSNTQRCSIFSRFPHASLRGVTVSPSTAMSQSLEVAERRRESRANSKQSRTGYTKILFLTPKITREGRNGNSCTNPIGECRWLDCVAQTAREESAARCGLVRLARKEPSASTAAAVQGRERTARGAPSSAPYHQKLRTVRAPVHGRAPSATRLPVGGTAAVELPLCSSAQNRAARRDGTNRKGPSTRPATSCSARLLSAQASSRSPREAGSSVPAAAASASRASCGGHAGRGGPAEQGEGRGEGEGVDGALAPRARGRGASPAPPARRRAASAARGTRRAAACPPRPKPLRR